jgi:hypothetical protein
VNNEAAQVLVAPIQSDLQGGMQVGDAGVAPDEQTAPDQWADAAQHDAQLIHDAFRIREGLRHCAIMTGLAASPVVPPALFPLSRIQQKGGYGHTHPAVSSTDVMPCQHQATALAQRGCSDWLSNVDPTISSGDRTLTYARPSLEHHLDLQVVRHEIISIHETRSVRDPPSGST